MLRLLGEVSAEVDGLPLDLGTPRQRCVLAALAVDTGRAVSVDRLVERVWGVDAAPRARATLHSYVSRLRRALAGMDGVTIVRRSGGYTLHAETDLQRFRYLRGREPAVPSLTEALALWRGEALTGVDGEWVRAERDRLEQERLAAEHDLVDARLRAGEGGQLVAELSARAARNPLDERVAGQYLLALHRAGRTTDALDHYRQVREQLVEELGVDPGAALQDLHRQILAGDLPTAAITARPEPVVPRQLPAAPVPFIGRDHELDRLDGGGTVLISALAGAGGIGKTWLALHWAHRHRDRFPDGQLFVDLRGFTPDNAPLDPGEALGGFLDALGVEPGRIPSDTEARSALFRSLVSERRMLILLDNAATAEQVVPLLPGDGASTVLVTSRRILTGLIARHGARHLDLGLLSGAEARALLERRLGEDRLAAEPEAVAALLDWCRGFPLALGILAGRAHTHPSVRLAELADEVRELGVDALDDDDPAASLPAVLAASHRALTAEQQRVFGLLGIAPGPDIGLLAAANLVGVPPARTARVLRALQDMCLLDRDPRGRYAMHDLIRGYAATTARDLAAEERDAALRRVVVFYTHTGCAAQHSLAPYERQVDVEPPLHPHPFADNDAALTWLDTEHICLMAAQQAAAGHHLHESVWHLARTLSVFNMRRGLRHDDLAVWLVASAVAQYLDAGARVFAHRHLGRAYAGLGRHQEGFEQLNQALTLAEQHGLANESGHTNVDLAWAWEQRGDDRKALEHARRALAFYRAFDKPVWQGAALNLVGWHAAKLGEYEIALVHCEEALLLDRKSDYRIGEASVLDSLGFIYHHTGEHEAAVDHYRQSADLFRELGHMVEVAIILEHLGHPHVALGRPDEARAAWREARDLHQQLGRDADVEKVERQLDLLDGGS